MPENLWYKLNITLILVASLLLLLNLGGCVRILETNYQSSTSSPTLTKETELKREDFNNQYFYAFDVLSDEAERILWDLYNLTCIEVDDNTGIIVHFNMNNYPTEQYKEMSTCLPEELWNDAVYETGAFFDLLAEIGFSDKYISNAIESICLVGTIGKINGLANCEEGDIAICFLSLHSTEIGRQRVFLEEFSNPYFYRNGLNYADHFYALNPDRFVYDDCIYDGNYYFINVSRKCHNRSELLEEYRGKGFINPKATENIYQDMNEIIKSFIFDKEFFPIIYNKYPLVKKKADIIFELMKKDNPEFGSADFWFDR